MFCPSFWAFTSQSKPTFQTSRTFQTSDTSCTSMSTQPGSHGSPLSGSGPSTIFRNKFTPNFSFTELFSSPLPGQRGGLRSAPWQPLGSPRSRSVPGGGAWAAPRSAARRSPTGWRAATRAVGATGRANWAERDHTSWNSLACYFSKPWSVLPPSAPPGLLLLKHLGICY